ncbi:cytosine permease [Leucobacter albus]|uniref:Cytosine permease n=1 Tax=Leucobacter albus TaxID=272210 RepID=A0ABW3TNZ3_9MICO
MTDNQAAAAAPGEAPARRTRSDYELGTVPQGERKHWLPIAGIWIAVGIDLSGTIMGVQLGNGLPFGQALTATILGSVLLGLLAMACTYVGAATGLTSAMLSRAVFGRVGGLVIAVAMAISSLGWFGVQTGFFADNARIAVHELFGADVSVHVFTIIGGLLMMLTALWGYRSIQRLSSWAVPLLIGLLLLAVVLAFVQFGTGDLLAAVEPQFSFGGAVSLVMGIFVFGVIVSPDIARWARTPKQAMAAGFVGFFIGNSLIVIVALVLSRVMGVEDLMRMFFLLGLGAIALIVLTLAQWTTNTNNLYSAALNLSVVFPRVSRRTLTLVGGVVAIGAALAGIYDAFIPFISLMGTFIAPYGGVYLAEFFTRARSRLRTGADLVPALDGWAFVAWGVGCAVGISTTQPGDGLGVGLFTLTTIPAVDAILAAFVTHALIGLVRRGGDSGAGGADAGAGGAAPAGGAPAVTGEATAPRSAATGDTPAAGVPLNTAGFYRPAPEALGGAR